MNPISQETLSLAAAPKRIASMASLRTLPHIATWLAFGVAALFAAAAQAAPGDNVALGKPVTMSGTTGDPTQAGANCTDGSTGGNYPADSICSTGVTQAGANREWIEVDLGQDYIIDRVRLSNRTDGSTGDLARWIVVTTRPASVTGVSANPLSTLDPALNPSAPFVNKLAYASNTTSGTSFGTAQGDPWTTLDLKVGTHIARYVRIYTMKPNLALNLAEIEVFEGPPPSRSILNPSFEQPSIAAATYAQIPETFVPGWSTTEPVAVPNAGFGSPFVTGGDIEMWNNGFGGVSADAGSQFAELNAFSNGALSPAPLCVYPGETFTWRVSHRARGSAGAVDVARLRINGQDVATLRDGVAQADPHTCTAEAGFTCTAQAGSPTAAGWGRWQGSWTNSLAQPKAMTFEFAAISSASGGSGVGNFIDNVSIAGLTAAVEFGASAATGPESVASANLPQLLVNGPVATAQTIQLDIVGGGAVRGTDYTTNPATGTIVVTIPAGTYDGTTATAISLAPYLQIAVDSDVEGAETIALRLSNASSGLSIAGASGCRTGIADSTYTITDEPVPTLDKSFAPDTIPYGGVATLTFLIDNSAAGAIDRSVAFTDNLAAGLQIADPANASTTCGGTIGAASGDNRVVFSGGNVAAGTFCTVTVDITNRPGFSGICYNPNFANENQNLVGLQNLIAQIQQFTCVSVTPPDCPDAAVTNGFGNISGLSPNLNNGISGQCVAIGTTIRLVKVSENATGSFGFTLGNTSATNPVTITTTAPGAPGTSSAVFDVIDLAQPVTLTESSLPPNWVLSGMACQLADGTPIGSFDAPSATWSVAPAALAYGQQISCTITNIADRFDFGDAPDSYGTLLASNGARHNLAGYDAAAGTAPLTLGTRVDHENDGFPSADASGDDSDGSDDEDAFFGAIALQPGATTVSLDVPVTNTTGGNANLYGWIDFNGNGRFDAAEAGNCPVVAAAATQVSCTWSGLTPLLDGFETYARFRLTTQALAAGTTPSGGDARAQGLAADGEVEDHRVSVATVLPLTCEAPFVETFGSYPVTPGAAAGWGPALPAGTTTYAFQPGPSAVAASQYALVTRPRLGNPAWQNVLDHTQGDTDGFAMIVNGSASPGVFYRHTFSGLSIGARYNFFASLANIVAGFNLGLPDVTLRVVDPATNAVLASINSGGLPEGPAGAMPWRQQQLVFTATQSQVRVELANNSGVLGGNDVALDDIGFAQVCELGDAPDSYATLNASNGAGHLFPGPGLSLGGGLPDGELDGQPSVNADGDDLNGSDDENAFPGGAPQLVIAAPYVLNVPVETTAGDATICAWVDLDQNGSFNAAEGRCSFAAGASVASFAWDAAATAGLTSGRAYLRLRIERNGTFPTDLSTADFLGVRGPGEVEDYVVDVLTPANVTLVKALTVESGGQAGAAEPGEQLTYTITLTNSGGTPATNYGVTDVLDPNVTFVSASNGGTAAGGSVTWSGLTVPANGALTLTVAVQVVDPIPSGVTQIGNVAYETGTTPPSCPPAGGQCVIVPTAPSVTVAKALTGESGSTPGQAEAGEQLTYTITLTNSGGSPAANYGVTDTLDPNVTFVSASNGGALVGGNVAWGGLTVPANGALTLTVVVQVASPIPDGVTQIGNVAYETGTTPPPCPPAGGQCVVVPTAPKVTVAKTASAPAPTGTPNQYAITYAVTATNAGGSGASYDLTDTLSFNGATVTTVSAPAHASSTGDPQNGTLGAFAAPSGGTIVTGEALAANGVETWTYTVTYTITDADTAADCSTPSGGLRNHALLGGASAGAPPADTCSGAPSVAIVKTAAAPVPTGTANEFTLTYTVNVSNSGSLAGVYDLADTLTFNGATVTAISAPTYGSSTGDTQDGTLGTFSAPSGGSIVSDETIAAGGAESWTYTVTYTVTDPATAQDCANPSGGLRNQAQLGGSLSGESTTCTGAPAVVIGKSASGPTPTGNVNEYALDYLVSVQNNGSLAGSYDLADTFTFAGVSVVSVSAITHGGGDPLSATLGTLSATGGSIVSGETIAASASETYAYRVVFTLDDVAAAGTCAAGGGLKNQAAFGGSSSGQVGTCSDVPNIAISKVAGAPTPTGTLHQYTIAYTVTVANSGAAAGSYDLADAFTFAGATIDAVSAVTHGGSDPLASTLGTLTAAGGTIVSAEPIAAAANETYTYTVTFTVTDAAVAADCTAPAGGLRNRAALGGSASGEAPVCTSAPNVVVSKTLTGESGALAGQAEPGEQLTYTITLTNTGGSAATGYGVTDTLDPNVTFVSADNGGTAAGGAVTWTGLTVPANGSLNLTVVVQVANPIPPGTAQIGNVAYETGTTPPSCPPAGGQCVIVPTAPSVAIAKALSSESGAVAGQAEAGEQLTYTITLTNSGGSAAIDYGVTDTLDPNVTFVSADNGGSAAGGVVSWSGLNVPANGSLTLTVVVRVVDPIPPGVTQIGNVAYETGTTPPSCPPAGGQCVIVPTAPQVTLGKTAGAPTPTGTPNQYAIVYAVSVRNSGGSVGSYDLADALTFNGAAVTAVGTPTYAGSNGEVQDGVLGNIGAPAGGGIVSNERIGAQGTETWTYTVTYTIDDADVAADCASPNGGLRNHASLGGGAAGAPAADTCTGAPSVNIVKTASAPIPTGSANQFALTYTVNIANSGSLPGRYDLADALTFNGATVDAISAPAYASTSGDTQDGTLGTFGAPDGGTIVAGETITAGGAESWTYTVTYTITDAGTAQDCADPAGGLRNDALLGGSLSGESTTCTGAPAVVIGKSASGPTPTGNPGEYRLSYLVSVQNNGTLPGGYDLADAFTFAGIGNVTVSAIVHGGGDPLATALGTLTATGGTIVSGETIAAGADETYAYSVTFTIEDAGAAGSCDNGGGLRNRAELGGSSSGQVGTCSDVPDIAIAKSATAPAPTGLPSQYALTYTVVVSNGGGAGGVYDLADAFAFAGATIDAVGAVSHVGPDPLATTLGTLTASGGSIVTGETIAAAGSESYTYTVTFTLTDPALADDCANPAGGLRNTAALGGSASGDARTCTGTPQLAIAKALTGESGSATGVAEPGEQLTYTITLTNDGSSAALDQRVTDRLDPNVTFVSADNGGTQVGGNVEWSGLTVAPGGSLALTVTVRVVDPIPAGVGAIGNVAYDPDIGPPDCETTPRPQNCTTTPTPSVVTIAKALGAESGSVPGVAEPGEQLTYTITLTNTGGNAATNYGVEDRLDPNTSFVSATDGGAFAAGVVSWSGLTIPANGSLVLTVVVQVADPIPAGVSQVANVAYETGTTPPSCPPAADQCVVIPTAGAVTIAKSVADANGNGQAEPGEQLTYAIVLTNSGGSAVTNYGVTDPLDANTTFVSADNGGQHAAGVVRWSGLTIPANGTLSLTVVVNVIDPLPAGVTQIGNLAYATGTTPPDCSATPRPTNCTSIEVPPPVGAPQLLITKTLDNSTLEPGGAVVYTITVRNVGTADATGVVVNDPIPAGIDAFAWTCAAAGGVTCPNPSGSGAIAETIATFPVGASLVYTVAAIVSLDPPATIVNTATVTPSGIATCAPAGTQPPCPATAIGTVPPQGVETLPVPSADLWALMLLGLGLLGLTWQVGRRTR